jgi:hypothetical protein
MFKGTNEAAEFVKLNVAVLPTPETDAVTL